MDSKPIHPISKLSSLLDNLDGFIDRTSLTLEQRKFKLYPSLAGSALFLALSGLILLLMPGQIKIQPDQAITARTFPSILVYMMMGGSIINLIKDLIKLSRKETIPYNEVCLFTEIKALVLLLFLIIYALLMPLIGFIASSVIYGILMLFYFRIRNWKYYLLVTVLAVIIGYLFKNILHVRLP